MWVTGCSEKLLVVLLAVLLALSPLRGAMASSDEEDGIGRCEHFVADHPWGASLVSSDTLSHDCTQCLNDCCSRAECTHSQCASAGTALASNSSQRGWAVGKRRWQPVDETLLSQVPPTPYRPPRV